MKNEPKFLANLRNWQWWDKATTRAIKTGAEAAVAVLGTGVTGILDVDWINLLSVTAMAMVVSYAISLAGLPEVDPNAPEEGE